MSRLGRKVTIGLALVVGFMLGIPAGSVQAETPESTNEVLQETYDLSKTPIKLGNHITVTATPTIGHESFYEVTLEEGREYIFTTTNSAAIKLRDTNGEVVKSFAAMPTRPNKDVLFSYKPSVTGIYTLWSDKFATTTTINLGLYELIEPSALVDMEPLMENTGLPNQTRNREYFIKSTKNESYVMHPWVQKGMFTNLFFYNDDITLSDMNNGAFSAKNNKVSWFELVPSGYSGPYAFYAEDGVQFQRHRWQVIVGQANIDLGVHVFSEKSGDTAKEYVKELKAENRELSLVADPVDAFAGNFVDNRTLLSYSGGNPLSFEMSYDSIANTSESLRGGFVHNFETSVKETEKGLDVYWTPNSVVRFNLVDGEYKPVQAKQSGISVTKTSNGFTVTDDSKQEYLFDLSGKLLTFTDKMGRDTQYTYTNDQLTAVVNSKGQSFAFTYDSAGKLLTVKDLKGRTVTFSYTNDLLVGVKTPKGTNLQISYVAAPSSELPYKVSQLTYDGVILVKNTYDNRGRVSTQLDGNKTSTSFGYDEYSDDNRVVTTITTGARKEVLTHDRLGNLLTKKDGVGHVETHTYDEHRNVVSTTDKNGQVFHYEYDAKNRLTLVKNPDKTTLAYQYDNRNNITKVTMPDGEIVTNTYNDDGLLIATIDRAGNEVAYTYDSNGNPTTIDREGYTLAYGYDATSGYLISMSTNDGPAIQFENDVLGRVEKTILPDDSDIQTVYDVDNNVVKSIDQKGQEIKSTVNAFGNVLTQTDVKGVVTTHKYDANGNRISSKTGDRETTFQYNAFNELVKTAQVVKGVSSNPQVFTYDNRGELTAVEDADKKITTMTYDKNGNKLTDKVGDSVTTYTYDSMGNNTAVTDSYGNKTTYTYDTVGNRLSEKTSSGSVISYQYDKMGRISSATDALGHVTVYSYDIRGNLLKVTDAKGAVTTYEYNDTNQQTVSVNALGERQENVYNALGQLTEVKNNRDEIVLSYEYDILGQVSKVTDGNGHTNTFTYDGNGNQMISTDAMGNVSETLEYSMYNEVAKSTDVLGNEMAFNYDGLGNLSQSIDAKGNTSTHHYTAANRLAGVTDPLSTRVDYTYDVYGQIASIGEGTDPNQTFTRDLNQNLIEEHFGANTLKYGYNAEQELTKKTNARGAELTVEYDANGRVVKETSPEGVISYAYDTVGNVLVVESADSRIERTYDLLGRVLTKTQDGETIGYVYDDRGQLVKMTYPNGKIVDYTYDVMGNLLTVTDWNDRVTSYEYNANNQLVKTKNANGTEEIRTYDAKGQIETLVNKKGSIILSSYAYSYDANGNIIEENDTELTYDALNRLTVAGDTSYTYSALGSITAVKGSLSDGSLYQQLMNYGTSEELLGVNDVATSVDADGNLTQYALDGETYDAVYNSKNQMISFDGVSYQYDGENNRIGLVEGDAETSFVVDNDSESLSRVLVETSGEESIYHIYGQGLIGSYVADDSFETNHYDYRGSVTGVSDETGSLVGSLTYDEYGVILEKDESITTRFLYNGKYGVQTDSNGLYYMRARYYSPDLKRFMNRDVIVGSISESQTLNRYAFVNGNPISYHDPFGLAREMLAKNSTLGHTVLDGMGMVPIVGEAFDLINAGWYLVEGDYVNAAFSGMAIVPIVGNASTMGKYGLKAAKHADDVVDVVQTVAKYGDDVAEVTGKGYTKLTKATAGDNVGSMLRKSGSDVSTAFPLSHFTSDVLKLKPKFSPVPNKWYGKGGSVTIAGDGIWEYVDWEGNAVKYINGFPDFKSAGFVRQEVILDGFSSSRYQDFKRADALASSPKEGTWHHHEDGVTLQDVNKKIHSRFKHVGGFSITNTK